MVCHFYVIFVMTFLGIKEFIIRIVRKNILATGQNPPYHGSSIFILCEQVHWETIFPPTNGINTLDPWSSVNMIRHVFRFSSEISENILGTRVKYKFRFEAVQK